jgi:hypothetical protein
LCSEREQPGEILVVGHRARQSAMRCCVRNDAERNQGNGARYVVGTGCSRRRPQDHYLAGGFFLPCPKFLMRRSSTGEQRSPKPRMGVRALPAQRSGTLRGESACTLPTPQWETPIAAGWPRVIRSQAARALRRPGPGPGLLAHLERAPVLQTGGTGFESPVVHKRDGMWCKGERASFGTR